MYIYIYVIRLSVRHVSLTLNNEYSTEYNEYYRESKPRVVTNQFAHDRRGYPKV